MKNWFHARLLLMSLIIAGAVASPPATAQKSDGEVWGDACLQSAGGTQCCNDKATAKGSFCDVWGDVGLERPKAICRAWLNTCLGMMACNEELNTCKRREMETDKDCSTDQCKKCTSDYKECHDKAVVFSP
jgi:hypothetical protein